MKDYKTFTNENLKTWELCDIYTEDVIDEIISKETPIGYLGQQKEEEEGMENTH